jgi:predicted GNAT family N-acyltransferase
MSDPLILTVPFNSQLGRLGFALRTEIFVGEQHVPPELEHDAYDAAATHIVAVVDGDVAGVLRIVFLPEHAKIGRVAVSRAARGQGIASAMMRYGMNLARARGEARLYLTSQLDKVGLYERLGFIAFGEQFTEAGMPHIEMKTY